MVQRRCSMVIGGMQVVVPFWKSIGMLRLSWCRVRRECQPWFGSFGDTKTRVFELNVTSFYQVGLVLLSTTRPCLSLLES